MNDSNRDYKIFEMSYLSNILKIIPLLAAFTYVIGYIVNQSYLADLGIPYALNINAIFFKSGTLVLLLFLPVIFTVYSSYDHPTDNLFKSIDKVPTIINHTVTTMVVVTLLVTLSVESDLPLPVKPEKLLLLLIFIMADWVTWFYVTSYAARGLSFRSKSILLLVTAIALCICAFFVFPQASVTLLKMYLITASTTFIFIGLYADKKLASAGLLYIFIIFLFACSYFGRTVYPAIPQHLGGTRPYIAALTVKSRLYKSIDSNGFCCYKRFSN